MYRAWLFPHGIELRLGVELLDGLRRPEDWSLGVAEADAASFARGCRSSASVRGLPCTSFYLFFPVEPGLLCTFEGM
jgi:hypothetical protein